MTYTRIHDNSDNSVNDPELSSVDSIIFGRFSSFDESILIISIKVTIIRNGLLIHILHTADRY